MGSHPGLPSPINLTRLGGTLALALAVVAPVVLTLWVSTPDVSDVQLRVASLARSYDVVLLRPDDVPKMLADAVIATEDERFYSQHGIDTVGLARAGLYDVANRCLCEGGSTITQQLVKQLYLNGSDRGYNKVVDMVLALKVEAILGKGQIMADYLSEIPTGVNRHGVADAACVYFHRPLQGLSLAQYALLAAVTQAPPGYGPPADPQAGLGRRAHGADATASASHIPRDAAHRA